MSVVLPPGSEYMYSGGGYTRLQLITEEVTGEPFTAFMQREILALLGMDNSSFEWNPGLQPMTAIPYGVGGRPSFWRSGETRCPDFSCRPPMTG